MATNSKDTFTERNPYLVYSDEFEDTKTDIMKTVGNMLEDTAITLSSEAVRAFDTVAEMQACTSLIDGMICHTNGFHASGDGGAAFYKISASGTANGMDVLACGDVLANLVITESYVTPEMFGAWGDGVHDDSASVKRFIAFNIANEINIAFGFRKTYALGESLEINNSIFIDLNQCTLKYIGLQTSIFITYFFDSASVVINRFGIANGTIDGNSLCDTVLAITGGKQIELSNLTVIKPLTTGLDINKTNYDVWEMYANNITVSGSNSSGIATFGIKIAAGVTDSYFENFVITNASNSWLYNLSSTNHFRNIHGYAYPDTNHPTYGMILSGNYNIYENIVIDTPYDKGILSNGLANVFRNINISTFSAESNRIGIIDNNYNTYDTIIAGSDCDIVIQSSAQDFISVKNFVNYSRPGKDLEFTTNKLPWVFDLDLQSSKAMTRFITNFEHRDKYATTGTEYTVTLPVQFRSLLDYDVLIVQQTVSGHSGYPYTIKKATDSIGITFYGAADTVKFDMFVKPFKW